MEEPIYERRLSIVRLYYDLIPAFSPIRPQIVDLVAERLEDAGWPKGEERLKYVPDIEDAVVFAAGKSACLSFTNELAQLTSAARKEDSIATSAKFIIEFVLDLPQHFRVTGCTIQQTGVAIFAEIPAMQIMEKVFAPNLGELLSAGRMETQSKSVTLFWDEHQVQHQLDLGVDFNDPKGRSLFVGLRSRRKLLGAPSDRHGLLVAVKDDLRLPETKIRPLLNSLASNLLTARGVPTR